MVAEWREQLDWFLISLTRNPFAKWLKEVFFWVKFVIPALLVLVLLSAFWRYDPDITLMKSFFGLRGVREEPKSIVLVTIADKDFEAPLKLSSKYLPDSTLYNTLIDKINSASPKAIMVNRDDVNLKGREAFTASTYHEELSTVARSTLLSRILKGKVPASQANTAPIIRDNNFVYMFPSKSTLFSLVSSEEEGRHPTYINFYGQTGTLKNFSFTQILQDDSWKPVIKNRIVLVALSSAAFLAGQKDVLRYNIPYPSDKMPGVEIQATMLANLMDKSFISDIPGKAIALTFVIVVLLSLSFATIQNFWVASSALTTLGIVVITGAYYGFTQKFLWGHNVGVIVATPLITLAVFMVVSLVRYFGNYYEDRKLSLIDRQEEKVKK